MALARWTIGARGRRWTVAAGGLGLVLLLGVGSCPPGSETALER